MKKLSIHTSILVLAGSMLLAGCGSKGTRADSSPPVVTGVAVETLHVAAAPEYYSAPGTVRSETTSVLSAQIGGTIQAIYVKPGDRVRRGQALALLDDRSVHAQMSAAEAAVEASSNGVTEVGQALQAAQAQQKLAEVTYNRYQALLAKNSVSRAEFDQVNANYVAATANVAALEARQKQVEAQGRQAHSEAQAAQTVFSYSRIVSPIDGVVTAKSADVGTVVMPGMPVLTVEDPAHYRLEASLPAEMFDQAHLGQTVTVNVNQTEMQGRVEEVVPSADPSSRTFLVKIALPGKVSSGDYGTAQFPLGEAKRLTVPRAALVERGELEGVFVVNGEGSAEYRLVKSGQTFGERVEILSGLADGDRIATSDLARLTDGARVEAQ
jgi:membrane fusion protein, multidrug efflux system